jgi:hypothetical protein
LIFIFSFFPWVGLSPGGVWLVSQSAWGAAFGGYSENKDMREFKFPIDGKATAFHMTTEKDIEKNKDLPEDKRVKDNRPNVSLLLLFFVLLLIPALVVTAGSVVLSLLHHVRLPPQIQQLMPWRWAIVAGLNGLLFLFLAIQLVLNFSLENNLEEWFDSKSALQKKEGKNTPERLQAKAERGLFVDSLERTTWLKLSVVLQLLALLCALLVFWLDKRKDVKPPPRLQLMW